MKKLLVLVLLLMLIFPATIGGIEKVQVPSEKKSSEIKKQKKTKTYYARITCYSIYEKNEKNINHRGRKISNSGGCAVPKSTLKDGTRVYIPSINKTFVVDDRIPRKSVKKHMRIAKKKNKSIDIVIDLRYNYKNKKKLVKKYMGYEKVLVYD